MDEMERVSTETMRMKRKKKWLLSRRELNPGLERCYEGLAH
jgi:hypothetical protein